MNFVAFLKTLFHRTPLHHCIYEEEEEEEEEDDERSISTAKKKKKKKRIRMFINKNYLSMTFIFLRGLS